MNTRVVGVKGFAASPRELASQASDCVRLRREGFESLFLIKIRVLKGEIPYEHSCGRSEGIRTPDILLPKQARYQLRYTPKY